jgi:hypothetical protein
MVLGVATRNVGAFMPIRMGLGIAVGTAHSRKTGSG